MVIVLVVIAALLAIIVAQLTGLWSQLDKIRWCLEIIKIQTKKAPDE